MAKIIWVASYPKSGNTWLRFLLANLIHKQPIASSEVARSIIPDIHEGIAGEHLWGSKRSLIKTHWAYHTQFPLREDTIGIIHLVRHPLTTLESNQNYAINRSGDLARQATRRELVDLASKFVDEFIKNGGHAQFVPNGIGTLEQHVASWSAPIIRIPRIQVKYEDLQNDPAAELKRLCHFLGIERSDGEIDAAIAGASLPEMRRIEAAEIEARKEGIFFQSRNEAAIAAGLRFVGRSDDGHSKYSLTQEQKQAAAKRFAGLIKQLGYA